MLRIDRLELVRFEILVELKGRSFNCLTVTSQRQNLQLLLLDVLLLSTRLTQKQLMAVIRIPL